MADKLSKSRIIPTDLCNCLPFTLIHLFALALTVYQKTILDVPPLPSFLRSLKRHKEGSEGVMADGSISGLNYPVILIRQPNLT